jgi:Rieske Fe-S protein
VETKSGNVVVVRTGETTFVAFSAKCPHSGGPVGYDADTKGFSCPWHGSTFGPDGKNTGGPARRPLTPVATQNALVLTLNK